MNPHVNMISNRLSLRKPQRESIEILDRITELIPPRQEIDAASALELIQAEFPGVEDFERDFPSLCFALATGVGKTRLMGAFISYLHLAHGIDNFFVLAPNLTIYNKLIADFTPGSPKYVFPGIASFAVQPPEIITGDNYKSRAGTLFDELIRCKINIFNISKINSEVKGGKQPRIKRLSEYLGESYFEYLASLPDLVMLMDESHRYRASAGVRAINELKPILGLELTATPFVTTGQRTEPFKNVVLDYPLRRAMEDGFVKEPAVVTRQNFNPAGMSAEELELLKLEDGVRLHEQTKVELETYARSNEQKIVKPFVLVIARDTTHAAELLNRIQADTFFNGRYKDRVIQVDSSGTGAERDDVIEKLLQVEMPASPIEIVIHVNMLKEGWDVTNLYTIVPLRAANARVLIEQTIGRGLRLPYGKRTGAEAVDRLSIVAHDRFQEIVDEARRPDSPIQLKALVLTQEEIEQKPRAVVAPSTLDNLLGRTSAQVTESTRIETGGVEPIFTDPAEQSVASLTYQAIDRLRRRPELVPTVGDLAREDVQRHLVAEVEAEYNVGQLALGGIAPSIDIPSIVERTATLVIDQTIQIPRITVYPVGDVESGYNPFTLDLSSLNYQPVEDTLWAQHLRTGETIEIGLGSGGTEERRLEDYVVSGLIDFDDVSYDDNAELLYDLAGQAVNHFRSYLDEEAIARVLRVHQKALAKFIHAQMQEHYWEDPTVEYATRVNEGFVLIRSSSFTETSPMKDFRQDLPDPANIRKYLFGGFGRSLQPIQKFESNAERKLSVVLDRDSLKWYRPTNNDFQILWDRDHRQYLPDFAAELPDRLVLIETKMATEMTSADVLAKRDAALKWCEHATDYARQTDTKPWSYHLIPHDAVAENWALTVLLDRWKC